MKIQGLVQHVVDLLDPHTFSEESAPRQDIPGIKVQLNTTI